MSSAVQQRPQEESPSPQRSLVVWCPDWPITARAQAEEIRSDLPIALTERGLVFACSTAARRAGVRRGLRLRDAQSRCADLIVFAYDPALDARAFEPVLTAIEDLMPGVQVLRPGTCTLRISGPARYYDGEEKAGAALLRRLAGNGLAGVQLGIADGVFTAELAARGGDGGSLTRIPVGASAAYLAPLPVSLLGQPALVGLLRKLGIRTLGQFASLDSEQVAARFGPTGARLQLLAQGLDNRRTIPRPVAQHYDQTVEFEPGLDRIDQVTFAFRTAAETFLDRLSRAALVCTAIRVEVRSESGQRQERSWLHPRSFTAAEVVDRVRWQLQGSGRIDSGLSAPISSVRVSPETVDQASNHEEGLWGAGPDERVHSGLSRVQSMLGHTAVLTAMVGGGRMLADRRVLVPWGDGTPSGRPADRPWPGSLPGLSPTTVFVERHPVRVLAPTGREVTVDARGTVSAPPSRLAVSPAGHGVELTAWAGPWPVVERWWDPNTSRSLNRFQVVAADGTAWLLVLEDGVWWAEGRYD